MIDKEYQVFTTLRNSEAYKKLMVLWLADLTDVESRRDSAAARGQESAWRYFAGQEKGFKKAMMKLDEVLTQIDAQAEEGIMDGPSEKIDRLLDEARGKTQ